MALRYKRDHIDFGYYYINSNHFQYIYYNYDLPTGVNKTYICFGILFYHNNSSIRFVKTIENEIGGIIINELKCLK